MAIANGGLCLDGEEKGRDEAIDIVDARRPVLILQMVQITPWEVKKGEGVRKGRGEGDKVGVKREIIDGEWEGLYLQTGGAEIYVRWLISPRIHTISFS